MLAGLEVQGERLHDPYGWTLFLVPAASAFDAESFGVDVDALLDEGSLPVAMVAAFDQAQMSLRLAAMLFLMASLSSSFSSSLSSAFIAMTGGTELEAW